MYLKFVLNEIKYIHAYAMIMLCADNITILGPSSLIVNKLELIIQMLHIIKQPQHTRHIHKSRVSLKYSPHNGRG